MKWGMIGGGRGSQIGGAHRIAATMDGKFQLVAGALNTDASVGQPYARELGIPADRAYGSWQEMLAAEKNKAAEHRLRLVTVATANNTHFEIAKAFLECGFNVLCEKPLTMTVEEAEELRAVAHRSRMICATNFGYSGYPMVIQASEMVRNGDLGDIRVVFAEFAHGFHAKDEDNARIRWRYDPSQAGVSSVTADAGIHALHMAEFITGQTITEIAAQFDRCVGARELEDDALLAYRLSGGSVGRLWTSAIATGQMHGFGIRIFGSKGGLRWHQEMPNQLYFSPINEPTRIIERGDPRLYPKAQAAGRIAIGHAEGMLEAFANIYTALYKAVKSGDTGDADLTYPSVESGVNMVRAVHAAAKSAANGGAWTSLSSS